MKDKDEKNRILADGWILTRAYYRMYLDSWIKLCVWLWRATLNPFVCRRCALVFVSLLSDLATGQNE